MVCGLGSGSSRVAGKANPLAVERHLNSEMELAHFEDVRQAGALLVPTGSSALVVSKADLNHLTRCLAVALAPSITVNAVVPGLMEGTRMFARVPPARVVAVKEQAALKRTTSSEDVARQVIAFCQSDSVTGQTQVIDSGVVFH
jgi:3-oxoacyl-[acyl-carrier protein] reductase